MNAIVQVSDASFEDEVIKSELPVLVDFWAPWCGPCRALAPILDEIATEYAGRLKVVKINIDEDNSTATEYGVRGIPTLLLIKDGQIIATKVGSIPKGQLATFIDSNI